VQSELKVRQGYSG